MYLFHGINRDIQVLHNDYFGTKILEIHTQILQLYSSDNTECNNWQILPSPFKAGNYNSSWLILKSLFLMCHTIFCPTLDAGKVEKAVTFNTVPYLSQAKTDLNTCSRNIFKIRGLSSTGTQYCHTGNFL
jgi:hypothetical protein